MANEDVENQTARAQAEAATAKIDGDSRTEHQKTGSTLGRYNYERNVRLLGTIISRRLLLRTFNEILKRGKGERLSFPRDSFLT